MAGAGQPGNARQRDSEEKWSLDWGNYARNGADDQVNQTKAVKHLRPSCHCPQNMNTKAVQCHRAWQMVGTGFRLRATGLWSPYMLLIYSVRSSSKDHSEESRQGILKDEVSAHGPSLNYGVTENYRTQTECEITHRNDSFEKIQKCYCSYIYVFLIL